MPGSKINITTEGDRNDPMREHLEVSVSSMKPLPVYPPPPSSGRISRNTTPQSNTPISGRPPKLAKVSDELVFESEGFLRICGRIHIKNLTLPSTPIVFKIKTTNPGKFHVWPTIGLISDRGSTMSKVTLKPNVDIRTIRQDKFQVEVMIVPRDLLSDIQAIEEDDQFGNSDTSQRGRRSSLVGEPGHSVSTLAELNEAWKRIAATGTPSEAHRVSISVDPNLMPSVVPAVIESSVIPSSEKGEEVLPENPDISDPECVERIERLESRLASLDDSITEQFTYLQWLIYALMAVLVAFTLINFGLNGVGSFFIHLSPANVKNAASIFLQTDKGPQQGGILNQVLPSLTSTAPPPPPSAPPVAAVTDTARDLCPLFG